MNKNEYCEQALWGFTLGRPNAASFVADLRDKDIVRPFDTYKVGASLIPDEDEMESTPVQYAWVKDPSGYLVDIREDQIRYNRVVLNVIDLDESIDFYTNILGLQMFRKRSNVNNRPRDASFCAYLVLKDS